MLTAQVFVIAIRGNTPLVELQVARRVQVVSPVKIQPVISSWNVDWEHIPLVNKRRVHPVPLARK